MATHTATVVPHVTSRNCRLPYAIHRWAPPFFGEFDQRQEGRCGKPRISRSGPRASRLRDGCVPAREVLLDPGAIAGRPEAPLLPPRAADLILILPHSGTE